MREENGENNKIRIGKLLNGKRLLKISKSSIIFSNLRFKNFSTFFITNIKIFKNTFYIFFNGISVNPIRFEYTITYISSRFIFKA